MWRLNTGMLNDPAFVKQMIADLNLYLQDNDNGETNPSIVWDAAKAVLRGKIIAWSTMLKKKKSQELLQLQDRLKVLEQSGLKDKNTRVTHQIRQIKQEIDKILGEEVEENTRFMKQRYYEAGPKAVKWLAWWIRKQQAENIIYKIRDPVDNKVVTDLDKIQRAFETYYKSLYSQSIQGDVNKITDFLNSLDLPTIGREANNRLTSLISQEEIIKAISSLNSN